MNYSGAVTMCVCIYIYILANADLKMDCDLH